MDSDIATASSASAPLEAAPSATAPAGCPPPLAWTEVLAQFRANAESFVAGTAERPVTGVAFGQGPPLYVLGGWSGSAELFCLTAWLLKDQMRCVVLDYPHWARRLDDLSQSVMAVADALGDREFHVLGSGFGSSVALLCATTEPDRVRRLILQGPIVRYQLSILERLTAFGCQWIPPTARLLSGRVRLLKANHALWFPPIDPTRFEFLAQNIFATPLRLVARRFSMLHSLDLTPSLTTVRCPTLVITSEGDPQRTKDASEALVAQIPQARAEVISNCGQIPFLTHPHRLVNLLKPFVFES